MFGNQLPGGNRFKDIYGLIEDATDELAHGGLLIMDNFGLQDAMSAIEIMDDRMDSGTRPPESRFNSETLLLPQEVCWILDKAFAAEMTWHSGVSLAQSILTLQHVHHIPKMRHLRTGLYNPDKPPELVGQVLRAGILGLVKCVDLVWRELAKNNAHDGEDWHGEKFEVSLCEGVAAATVVDSLDEALAWLDGEKRSFAASSDPSPNDLQMLHWYTLLIHRLELRRAILLALSRSLASEADEMSMLLEDAQADLDRIRQTEPPPDPSPDSPALHAIDQNICRTLTVLMPVKIIPLFDQQTTWQWLHHLIAGLLDIAQLSSCERLLSWQTYARIHAWAFDTPRRTPFLRSLLMTAFMSGTLVLGRYQSPWLVDHYLSQVARVPQATLVHLHESGRISMTSTNGITSASILQRFENDVIANLKDYFYSYFENRPRQRRKLSNMLLELHKLHAQARAMSEQAPVVEGMLLVLHSLRLNAILEVVLSGFELQLYSREEDPFVYWYASYVVEQRTDVLRDTLKHLFLLDDSEDTSAIDYATCELDFATAILKALKGSSLVLRLLDHPPRPHDAHRTRLSVERRFKWAFLRDYAVIPLEDEARPDLELFALAPEQKLQGQELLHEAARLFDDAAEAFSRLRDRGAVASGSELCHDSFQEFILNLIEVCTSNSGFLRVAQTYQNALRWEVQLDGWFQRVKGFTPAVA